MFGLGSRVASTAAPAGGVFSRSSAATSSLVWSIYGNAAAVRASQARAFRTTPHLADVVIPYMLTDVGEGIAEVEVMEWKVAIGDTVSKFDPLVEVQSDKASVEITSKYSGVVTELCYAEGDMAITHTPLVMIEVSDADAAKAGVSAGGDSASPPAAPAAAAEAEPVPQADPAPRVTDPSPAAAAAPAPASFDTQTINRGAGPVTVKTLPAVRMLAKKNNVDLSKVRGSGHDGRILKGDVLKFIEGDTSVMLDVPVEDPATMVGGRPAPVDEVRPVRGLMKTMIKTMTDATAVPHFGYCDEIAMNRLVEMRAALKPVAADKGVKLTFMPFFLKAASLALTEYPMINSQLNPDLTEIILKGSHNIGVAMDTPMGLIVPNIKDVQARSVLEVAEELSRLGELGAAGKLGADDLSGGTFTLSNIGSIGGTYTSPVLMLPQVAIGALGKMQTLPRFAADGSVEAASIVNVSWAADHRVIDGATMANFSNLMKAYLEEPERLVLHST